VSPRIWGHPAFFFKDIEMPQETRPMRPEDGWPISHTKSTEITKCLAASPGVNQSWYVTGFILSGRDAEDGFSFLRRDRLLFNASNENLDVSDDAALQPSTGDFAIEFGIQTSDVTLAAMISKWDSNNGYNIEVLSTGQLKVTFGDGTESHNVSITSTQKINDNKLHHVVVNWEYQESTKDGLSLYIDGESAATAVDNTGVGSVTGSSTALIVLGNAQKSFYLSTLGLYKAHYLTAAEIAVRWAGGVGSKFLGTETDISACWNIDEGTGATCYDLKGSNDGSRTNATWVSGGGFPIDPHELKATITYLSGVWGESGGTPSESHGIVGNTVVHLPHAIKIGRNNPLFILATGGAFALELYGFKGSYA